MPMNMDGWQREGRYRAMKVFVDLTRFAATANRAAWPDMVGRLEDAGATGVGISDHLFYTRAGRPRRDAVDPGCDPVTLRRSAQMAEALLERREAYGLERISLSGAPGIRSAPADPVRFCREVLPLLDRH